jgi:hypothetical protein
VIVRGAESVEEVGYHLWGDAPGLVGVGSEHGRSRAGVAGHEPVDRIEQWNDSEHDFEQHAEQVGGLEHMSTKVGCCTTRTVKVHGLGSVGPREVEGCDFFRTRPAGAVACFAAFINLGASPGVSVGDLGCFRGVEM